MPIQAINLFHPDLATVLLIISALVIPALSALLAKAKWDSFWVGIITGFLSVVNGVLTPWLASDVHKYDWQTAFSAALFSWLASIIITRGGLLRATGADKWLLTHGNK